MNGNRQITKNIFRLGGNDRRLALFENVYPIPQGVSYNAYLVRDEKNVLLDTVDEALAESFFPALAAALEGGTLDYVIVNHMEPDHCATLSRTLTLYPKATVVGNAKTFVMLDQFFPNMQNPRLTVKEGDTLSAGTHTFHFVMAPMVHWPEVMVTYESSEKVLFSADAFGSFGTVDGSIFADEAAFDLSEYRRYYTNIVGKYGVQVNGLLKKAEKVEISYLCPLHGRVWRKDLGRILEVYQKWASYQPEERGVAIFYASIYGHTAQAAERLAETLCEQGVTNVVVYDVSATDASYLLAEAFRFSHLVFASSTYNGGIFVKMEQFLAELKAHNLQNRTVGLMENGTWAPMSGKLMRDCLGSMKNMTVVEPMITLRSALRPEQQSEIEALAKALADTL